MQVIWNCHSFCKIKKNIYINYSLLWFFSFVIKLQKHNIVLNKYWFPVLISIKFTLHYCNVISCFAKFSLNIDLYVQSWPIINIANHFIRKLLIDVSSCYLLIWITNHLEYSMFQITFIFTYWINNKVYVLMFT